MIFSPCDILTIIRGIHPCPKLMKSVFSPKKNLTHTMSNKRLYFTSTLTDALLELYFEKHPLVCFHSNNSSSSNMTFLFRHQAFIHLLKQHSSSVCSRGKNSLFFLSLKLKLLTCTQSAISTSQTDRTNRVFQFREGLESFDFYLDFKKVSQQFHAYSTLVLNKIILNVYLRP